MYKLLASMVLVSMILVASCAALGRRPVQGATFAPPRTGSNYYAPDAGRCPRWTWLGPDCYPRAQQGLSADAALIAHNHLGGLERVWIILDQGIRWSADGTYQGLDSAYLTNLDDALARFAAQHIQVDAVLLEASAGTSDQNQFGVAALDGTHPALHAGYLAALRDFAGHVASVPTDAATIAVVDTLNEAYVQLERFGIADQDIHAFLRDAYGALKGGDPSLVVTVSDTERLLKDQASWEPMYADSTDVYDIHAYADKPWDEVGLWARARSLSKPWFVGEAGCAPGHVSCTYDGTAQCTVPDVCALSVDSWWLAQLPLDGARAVLVEDAGTAWTQSGLTALGHVLGAAGG